MWKVEVLLVISVWLGVVYISVSGCRVGRISPKDRFITLDSSRRKVAPVMRTKGLPPKYTREAIRRSDGIVPGVGTRHIQVGDSLDKIEKLFGELKPYKIHNSWELDYRFSAGVTFYVSRRTRRIRSIVFHKNYLGKTIQGIEMGRSLNYVARVSGGILKKVRVSKSNYGSHGKNRVLYIYTNNNPYRSFLFRDECRGMIYAFDRNKRLIRIHVKAPLSKPDCR